MSICPTCGSTVEVHSGREGTSGYVPLTDADLTYRIQWALQVLANPSENDEQGIPDRTCMVLASDILKGAIREE